MRSLRPSISKKRMISRFSNYGTTTCLPHRRSHSLQIPSDSPCYQHIDDVERLERYKTGGYHPVHIGDYLDGKYRIIHKLGYGSYSTTWLATQEPQPQYVAVKVCMATSSNKEADIIKLVSKDAPKTPGWTRELVPAILDRFQVHGPNGTHPCLVTQPAMCSVADTIMAGDYRPFQTYVARSLAAQLAMAVAHVHSRGYAHGDLHFGNLLLRLPIDVAELTVEQLFQRFDAPIPEAVVREDGQALPRNVPPHVYSLIWMGKPNNEISMDEARLVLTDFGTAFRPDEDSRLASFTPIEIRPPETRFEPTIPLGLASDIWSLGCMIWALLGVKPFLGAWLFGPESATAAQVDALGAMPDEWWQKWQAETNSRLFEGNGEPKPGRDVWTFARRFEDSIQRPRREKGMEEIGEDEGQAFFELIRGMLKFRPGERMSAAQVLEAD